MSWVRAGNQQDNAELSATKVVIGENRYGRPVEGLVVGPLASGEWVAYVNRCRHQPLPLDSRPGEALIDADRQELICAAHGARYRMRDGVCTAGPCPGEALVPLRLERRGNEVWVEPPTDAVLQSLR